MLTYPSSVADLETSDTAVSEHAARPWRREIFVMGFLNSTLTPPPQRLCPEELSGRLSLLIRWYTRRRSTLLAFTLTEYLEALRTHHGSSEAETLYAQMANLWNRVATPDHLELMRNQAWRAAARPLLWP